MTSFGPVTGNAATGVPQASASSCTTPKRVGQAREHEDVGGGEMRGQILPLLLAEENRVGIFLFQCRPLRAVADHDLGARQVERQEGVEVLLHRDAAHGHEDRPRQIELRRLVGIEQLGVDAAGPKPSLRKPRSASSWPQRGSVATIVIDARGVEAAQHRVADAVRNAGACRDIFRKARGVGGGEGELVALAIAAHRPADRPFGRDMDRLRARPSSIRRAISRRFGSAIRRPG